MKDTSEIHRKLHYSYMAQVNGLCQMPVLMIYIDFINAADESLFSTPRYLPLGGNPNKFISIIV